MTIISIEALKENSSSYANQHGIKQSDADLASELHDIIRATRTPDKPMAGDIMICIGTEKEYHDGHIDHDDLAKYASICTKPYVPFVFKMNTKKPQVSFNASGGYWFRIPKPEQAKIRYIGKRTKLFKAWGHCGICKNGAFTFPCKVNVWSYELATLY